MSKRTCLAISVAAACLASHVEAAPAGVKATDVWCRAAPVGATTGGCYFTLTARADDRLLKVETPAADHGEVHSMSMDGGVMRMRPMTNGLALPAGKPVSLGPGGDHLMIIGLKQSLTAGRTIPLTLRFAKAPPLKLRAPVKAQDGESMPMPHMKHQ